MNTIMTGEQNLTVIREACVRANPEIESEKRFYCDDDECDGHMETSERPIRLADVLLAIHALEPSKRPMYFSAGADGGFYEAKYTYPDGNHCVIEHNGLGGMGVGWKLKADSLEDQSPETLEFLANLINNK